MDKWEFGPARDDIDVHKNGTILPHRVQKVLWNGVPVGEIEIHMHQRYGQDGKPDVSFGITAVVFGPPLGGK